MRESGKAQAWEEEKAEREAPEARESERASKSLRAMQLLEAWATARLEELGVDGVFAPYIVGMLPSHGGDDEDLDDAKFNIHQVLMGWLAPEDEVCARIPRPMRPLSSVYGCIGWPHGPEGYRGEFVDELAKLADSPTQLTEAAMAMAAEGNGANARAIANGLADINDAIPQAEELKASAPTFVPGALSRAKFHSPVAEYYPIPLSSGSPDDTRLTGSLGHFGNGGYGHITSPPPPMHENGVNGAYDVEDEGDGESGDEAESETEDGAALQNEDSFFWSVAYEVLKFPDVDPNRLCDLLRLVGLDVDKAHAVLKATLERESIGPGQVCRHYLQGECRRADCMAEHCVFAHDFCEFYSLDDSALAQRDYDSEDEDENGGAPLDFQAEDMFPSLQSAASGTAAPPPPPPPRDGSEAAATAAANIAAKYPSTQDAVANLTMNFARAVALQPAPMTSHLGADAGGYGMETSRRLLVPLPPSAPHRTLYHKAGSNEGIGSKWVGTGQSVATQYLELREQAYQMACARNKCFMGATQAYRKYETSFRRHGSTSGSKAAAGLMGVGNKALAKGLSKQGHDYNAKMKNFHFLAASEIFEARNPPSQLYMERMMDLHGLHVAEAVEFLTQMLPKLADEGVDNIYLVTGSGHHSKGPNGNARLLPAVERFLTGEGYQFTAVADGRGFVGMLLVDLRW
ncbi:hypothetical protein BBJ28_00014210 [Nothophytophthora sp. Chile5]|nr:hypothetical protein BBJ28_00014210 [Nothophytophthora sp. Chile5]